MAWIEDSDQCVFLVRQAAGLKLWTFPGGKVKPAESLVKALKREVYEETGLRVQIGSLLGVLDRRDKDAITLLFAAIPNNSSVKAKQKPKEIKEAGFHKSLPQKASPSAKYFWSARRRPVNKTPKVQVSTHQFPAPSVIAPKPEFFLVYPLKFDTGRDLDLQKDFGQTCNLSTPPRQRARYVE